MTEEGPRAALDIGSNTVRLYVGKLDAGTLVPLHDDSEFVRLGLDVDATGRLRADRQDAAVEAIVRLAALAQHWGAGTPIAVATSAVRDADNSREFVARVRDETGLPIEVLSGEREAELTFLGATLGMTLIDDTIVVDLGGGSAEVIGADVDGLRWGRSLQLGSGRLTQRFVTDDPPSHADLEDISAYVRSALVTLPPLIAHAGIFTGGTASHIVSLMGKGPTPVTVAADELLHLAEMIANTPKGNLVQRFNIKRQRADVLAAGVWTLHTIVDTYRLAAVTVTRTGIREGVLIDAFRRAGTHP